MKMSPSRNASRPRSWIVASLDDAVLGEVTERDRINLPRLRRGPRLGPARQRRQARALDRKHDRQAEIQKLHVDVGGGVAVRALVRVVELFAEIRPVGEIR